MWYSENIKKVLEKRCRDEGEEETPVPIPNTEVKLFSADGTWRETSWESRSLRLHKRPLGQVVKTPPFHGGVRGSNPLGVTKSGRIAQLGEHLPYKQGVIGSSPIAPTTYYDLTKFM